VRDEGGDILTLLHRLGTDDPDRAWESFVETYGPILLQVAHHLVRDPDDARDCFVHVCEQLAANRFRRLRRYGPRETATFVTWLRCVARHLCIDWLRRRTGRPRSFEVILGLSPFEQRVFALHFAQQRDLHETTAVARTEFPESTRESISAAVDRIHDLLSPRQRWLLSTRTARVEPLEGSRGEAPSMGSTHCGSPEDQLLDRERRTRLSGSVGRLSSEERLLLKLRFEEDRSLRVCADALGLGNAQRADRMVRSILARLRAMLSEPAENDPKRPFERDERRPLG